jgi:hypothetical protein
MIEIKWNINYIHEMDIAFGFIFGIYCKNGANNLGGGAKNTMRKLPTELGEMIDGYFMDDDIVYSKEAGKILGTRPGYKCRDKDFIEACSSGIHKLKYLIEKCPHKNNILQNPFLNESKLIVPGSIKSTRMADIMRVRQECILAAARAKNVDVLKWLLKLPGFHFMQHWKVLLQTEPHEIYSLDINILKRIRD